MSIKIGLSAYHWPSVEPGGDLALLRWSIPSVVPIYRRFPYDLRVEEAKRDAAVEKLLTDTKLLNVIFQPCIIGVPGTPKYQPSTISDVDKMADAAKKASIKFKDRIKFWQILNEPNDDVPYDLYATVMNKVGLALRCGSPYITVLAGGLKGIPSDWRVGQKVGLPAAEYTRKALASADGEAMRQMITWYAVHAYQETPSMNYHVVNAMKSEVPGVRIVVTEMGFHDQQKISHTWTAAWFKETIDKLETLGVVEQVNWFGWKIEPTWVPPSYRGLVDAKGLRLPLFHTFCELAKRVT